jgi:hypothetical protein
MMIMIIIFNINIYTYIKKYKNTFKIRNKLIVIAYFK